MRDITCRICVIGDAGVGKTSLVASAATETFPDAPPPVLPPARLPADTSQEVPVVITDSSSRPEDKQALELACQEASVIVLCFAMDKPDTLRRVSSYWMPELRRLGVHVPVMLVGCKSDIRPADNSLHQAVLPIVKAHPQIETCMECSAKKLQFVGEVFYYALKSVVHPMAPLYDSEAEALRPLCARALKRIFLLCDADRDGILNDDELNRFQMHCFNAPLQPEELVGVKQVVSQKIPQGVDRDGLALPGFLFLHALFIQRGRLETTWAVLRRRAAAAGGGGGRGGEGRAASSAFGYGNDLELSGECLDRVSFAHAPDQVVELTEAGRRFFAAAFDRFDSDDDGVLSAREREEAFSTAPRDPWEGPEYEGLLVETSRKGLVTLSGFLSLWAYTTAQDPRKTLAYALYLGYPDDAPADRLFAISRPRRQERRGSDSAPWRSVLQCYVFAAGGVDTAGLLEGLIAQARPAHGAPPGPLAAAAAAVPAPDGAGPATTLVLRSFHEEQVGEECSALAVKPPVPLGAKPGTAVAPELAIPETPSLRQSRAYQRMLRRALLFTGAGTAAVLAAYLAWRLARDHRSAAGAGSEPAGGTASSSGGGGGGVARADGAPAAAAAAAAPPAFK
eukprot:scaffold12.g7934.t1